MIRERRARPGSFGIAVNLIEPGYMRTDFLTSHSLGLPTSAVDAYPGIREMTEVHQAMPGTQLGDPAKAAEAIIAVAMSGSTPLHKILGSDSLGFAEARVELLTSEIAAARPLAVTTDIVAEAASGIGLTNDRSRGFLSGHDEIVGR